MEKNLFYFLIYSLQLIPIKHEIRKLEHTKPYQQRTTLPEKASDDGDCGVGVSVPFCSVI